MALWRSSSLASLVNCLPHHVPCTLQFAEHLLRPRPKGGCEG